MNCPYLTILDDKTATDTFKEVVAPQKCNTNYSQLIENPILKRFVKLGLNSNELVSLC